MFRSMLVALLTVGCTELTPPYRSSTLPASSSLPTSAPMVTSVTFHNQTTSQVTVFVSFGADSVISAKDWSFCHASSPLNCQFSVAANVDQVLPSQGYLNATFAVNQPVSCGSTKAEINVNHPGAYDVADISLVDGFNVKMSIELNGAILGPPVGKEGNEKVFGVYPLGCDVCTARENPPCGIPAGSAGCKTGTQYKPDVPCQAQGSSLGGGGTVKINLLP